MFGYCAGYAFENTQTLMPKATCPQCGQSFDAGDSFPDSKSNCPSCDGVPHDHREVSAFPPSAVVSHGSVSLNQGANQKQGSNTRFWSTWWFRASLASMVVIALVRDAQFRGRLPMFGAPERKSTYLSADILGTFVAVACFALIAALVIATCALASRKAFRTLSRAVTRSES